MTTTSTASLPHITSSSAQPSGASEAHVTPQSVAVVSEHKQEQQDKRQVLTSLRRWAGTHGELLVCASCGANWALHDQVMSTQFRGRLGRAVMVYDAVNVRAGPPVERQLLSGHYTISELACAGCGTLAVGWRYLSTPTP